MELRLIVRLLFLFFSAVLLGLAFGGAYLFYRAAWIPRDFLGVATVLVFVLGFIAWSAVLYRATVFVSPVPEGKFPLSEAPTAWFALAFLSMFCNDVLVQSGILPPMFRAPLYGLLGTKMGKNVSVASVILDPSLVTIGDNVILGLNTIISGHSGDGGTATIGRVKIGSNVLIGGCGVILPNVVIGDGATVSACSLVTKGTIIPPGELWGGNPARCLKKARAATA